MIDRLEVVPGIGTVIRRGELAAWAAPTASLALVSFIDQSARNLAGSVGSGGQLVGHLAATLTKGDPEPGVGFVVVGPDAGAWVALLHGAVQAWDGVEWVAPDSEPGWTRCQLAPQPSVAVGSAGEGAPPASLESMWDLESGVVPGGGFVLTPHRRAERPAETAAERAGAAADPPIRQSAEVAEPPIREPPGQHQATVVATLCGRGHANRPGMSQCARCGEPVMAWRIAQVERPPLGCLVLDDGSVFRLDAGYSTGSGPGAGHEGRPLILRSSDVSPLHVEISLEGWDVTVADQGSSAGTFVYEAVQESWVRLIPFERRVLEPGSHLSVGGRVLTYVTPYVVQEPETRSR